MKKSFEQLTNQERVYLAARAAGYEKKGFKFETSPALGFFTKVVDNKILLCCGLEDAQAAIKLAFECGMTIDFKSGSIEAKTNFGGAYALLNKHQIEQNEIASVFCEVVFRAAVELGMSDEYLAAKEFL